VDADEPSAFMVGSLFRRGREPWTHSGAQRSLAAQIAAAAQRNYLAPDIVTSISDGSQTPISVAKS
jgi:hypothetical protein